MNNETKNKWQITIDELLTVFKGGEDLTAAVNEILGDSKTTNATLNRIKNAKMLNVSHDLGQALLILHVRYIPIRRKEAGIKNG